MEDKYIVALEVGSSKISGAIGSVDPDGILTVKAVEEEPMIDCVRYGQLSNIKVAADVAERILRKIENRMSPRKVKAVYVAIGGRSLCSQATSVERRLSAETEVTADLLDRLNLEARTAAATDRDILDVVPREYIVDNTRAERPEGMYCSDIRMDANLIVCRPQLKRNLDLLVDEKLARTTAGYIVRPLAEAALVLTPDERKLGCMMVDLGAETTSVAIYRQGALQYLATLPLGSRNITRDLTTLGRVEEDAEEIKKTNGNANPGADAGEAMSIPDVNNLVSHRAAEIIANIKEQLKYAGFTPSELAGGIVLVGRGAKLTGFSARLEKETGMRVRSGSAMSSDVRIGESRISPSDTVDVISILLAASRNPVECLTPPERKPELEVIEEEPEPEHVAEKRSGGLRGIFTKIGTFIKETTTEPAEDDDDLFDDREDDR